MSMETKHTPGPWEAIDSKHGLLVRTESPSKTKYGASRYAAIGGFESGDKDQYEEAKANARLIAAAPELFEALKWMIQRADEGGYPDGRCLKEARLAIAKATGQEV